MFDVDYQDKKNIDQLTFGNETPLFAIVKR